MTSIELNCTLVTLYVVCVLYSDMFRFINGDRVIIRGWACQRKYIRREEVTYCQKTRLRCLYTRIQERNLSLPSGGRGKHFSSDFYLGWKLRMSFLELAHTCFYWRIFLLTCSSRMNCWMMQFRFCMSWCDPDLYSLMWMSFWSFCILYFWSLNMFSLKLF